MLFKKVAVGLVGGIHAPLGTLSSLIEKSSLSSAMSLESPFSDDSGEYTQLTVMEKLKKSINTFWPK